MRVLLDECLPRRLSASLVGHDVTTVPEAGWAGVTNGALLDRIGERFDAFITIDGNLTAQQAPRFLAGRSFGVVILRAPSNRLDTLKPLIPDILNALVTLRPAELIVVTLAEP